MRVGLPQRYTNDAVNITGEAWREISYVHVTWGWLAFLAGELLLAATFVTITIIGQHYGGGANVRHESRSVPPDLKDSSLAVLSALSTECRARMGDGIRPIEELNAASKRIWVRLEGGEIVPVEYAEGVTTSGGSTESYR